jgi:hypothetical protein
VLFALVYLLLRRVVLWIAGSSDEQMNTEVELVVLRHQLMVFRRQVAKPRLRRRDRLFMAAISRVRGAQTPAPGLSRASPGSPLSRAARLRTLLAERSLGRTGGGDGRAGGRGVRT